MYSEGGEYKFHSRRIYILKEENISSIAGEYTLTLTLSLSLSLSPHPTPPLSLSLSLSYFKHVHS